MTEFSQHTPEHSAHPHYQHAVQHVKDHRFITMIIGSIVVESFLVFVAMSLYTTSGAAQLDLSKPGNESIRNKLKSDDSSVTFSSSGPVDEKALNEFETKYNKVLGQAKQPNSFATDILSQSSLQIDQDSAINAAQSN